MALGTGALRTFCAKSRAAQSSYRTVPSAAMKGRPLPEQRADFPSYKIPLRFLEPALVLRQRATVLPTDLVANLRFPFKKTN